MAVVGGIGLEVIVRVQDASGTTPPTSMFTAAAVLISLISTIAVSLAARSSGIAMRASIALGGAFGAIAIAKFALGPVTFFHGTAGTEFQDPFAIGDRGMMWAIAFAVGLLYIGVVMLLARWQRPRVAAVPRLRTGVVLVALAIGVMVIGAFITTAPAGYLGFALTGVGATALAVALVVAATLIALAFRDTAKQAQVVGTASVYLTVVWVAVAFLLVFQILWVVFLLAVVTIWPLRTVTPK
jgi:hypothetical protein